MIGHPFTEFCFSLLQNLGNSKTIPCSHDIVGKEYRLRVLMKKFHNVIYVITVLCLKFFLSCLLLILIVLLADIMGQMVFFYDWESQRNIRNTANLRIKQLLVHKKFYKPLQFLGKEILPNVYICCLCCCCF